MVKVVLMYPSSECVNSAWYLLKPCHDMQDKRLAWYDMDLSTKPYRALHYHNSALRSVAFHPTYPLFASASDDATVHIFHGMVYQVQFSQYLL